ncbi:hypothetical protein DNTS_009059, partial [Danionella cerebrum]
MEIMNDGFASPSSLPTFRVGVLIPIRAALVQSKGLQPWRIFMDNCQIFTQAENDSTVTTPEVDSESPRGVSSSGVYPIISNAGCLVESKEGNSSFLPRRRPEEILLHLQSLRFALGQKVFFGCDLQAWKIESSSLERKACHYKPAQHRWELLDNPTQSYVCSCCDFSCTRWSQPDSGVAAHKVVGPFIMMEEEPSSSGDTDSRTEQGLKRLPLTWLPLLLRGMTESLLWLLIFSLTVLLILLMVLLALMYYLCVWRGGRMRYMRTSQTPT